MRILISEEEYNNRIKDNSRVLLSAEIAKQIYLVLTDKDAPRVSLWCTRKRFDKLAEVRINFKGLILEFKDAENILKKSWKAMKTEPMIRLLVIEEYQE